MKNFISVGTIPFIVSTTSQSNTPKVDLYGFASTANTNILSTPINSTIQASSIWIVYVISSVPCMLTAFHTQISTNSVFPEVFTLQGLNKSDLFNMVATTSETINFQTNATTTLQRFNVCEIVPVTSAQGS
jgi:hypothetical protein